MTENNDKMKILIVGATGYVGGHLVPALLKKGYQIRCMVRSPEKLLARNWKNVEIVEGDVLKPETLSKALENTHTAYYLVHSMGGSKNFEKTDSLAAANFSKAAKEANIQRIIYLGGLAKDTESLSSHLKSRQEVGTILGSSGVPVTELRASIIIGSGSASFEIIRDLVKKLPVMVTPKWVKSQCEPISIQNVIDYLALCLDEPRTINQVLEIGSGDILTYAGMMRQVAEVMEKKLWIISVPVLTPRLSAYWLNLVTTVPMSIAYPLVDGLKNDTVCTDHRIRDWIKIDLISFTDAVKKAIQEERMGELDSRWTEASGYSYDFASNYKNVKLLQDKRVINSPLSQKAIFDVIQKVGGDNGWYYANWAWRLRGLFDRLIGGVGMRRGRRHPTHIRVGDAIDFWRVEKFETGHILKLRAEMKLPGIAWLEFRVEKAANGESIFQQLATFLPKNWFGFLYWYCIMPAHFFVFRNMARKIVEAAQQNAEPN